MYYFCTVHYLLSSGTFGPGDVVWIDNIYNVYITGVNVHITGVPNGWLGTMPKSDVKRFLIPLPANNEAIINKIRVLYT